jgi:hypothetical protein
VASKRPGASLNDITDDTLVDALSGCTDFNGIPVIVKAVAGEGPEGAASVS